ncbi:MAG: hypothetical protein KGL35_02425 [Bradyrhizobium sp.]|nr:hypothetical protein [Bradyrhizobium sp.]
MSVSSEGFFVWAEKREGAPDAKTSARHQRAQLSSDVAEVVKRPKKRPGRRLRSSITTRRQTVLV